MASERWRQHFAEAHLMSHQKYCLAALMMARRALAIRQILVIFGPAAWCCLSFWPATLHGASQSKAMMSMDDRMSSRNISSQRESHQMNSGTVSLSKFSHY